MKKHFYNVLATIETIAIKLSLSDSVHITNEVLCVSSVVCSGTATPR